MKRKEELMADYHLSVKGISKHFGSVKAVDEVSFTLQAKSTLVIKGASGSGKTTLLRLIAGLEAPDKGTVAINGIVVSSSEELVAPHLRKIGFIFQTSALWPHLTVKGNILFGLSGGPKKENEEKVAELLERTGLSGLGDRYPDQLSGGQARRVALARSLAPQPQCLLMDEPLTNLDDQLKGEMLELITTESSRLGSSLLYVTHDSREAKKISNRILFMDKGRLIENRPNSQ